MSLPSSGTNPHTHSQFKMASNSSNEIHTESLPTILWILRYDCILIQQFECGRKGRRERSLRNLATSSSSASWLTHSAARVSFTTSKSSFPPLPPPPLSFLPARPPDPGLHYARHDRETRSRSRRGRRRPRQTRPRQTRPRLRGWGTSG